MAEQAQPKEPVEPPKPLDANIINRFRRFLHTGKEGLIYFPGCWWSHKYFEDDKLVVVKEVLDQCKNNVELVSIILKAYKDGYCTRFETIVFAMAMCLRYGGEATKVAVYKAMLEICNTSEELMIFAKITKVLKTGNGQGWCRSVRRWYNSRDPMVLAKEMSRVKGSHGRSHKILITKSHLKSSDADIARYAVIKYGLYGLKKAKQAIGNHDGVKQILEYIQKVEDLRHCEDAVAAADIILNNKFTIKHVPGHLLTSQQVWDAVLPQFTLEEVLNNIQRIHNMGFLTPESSTTSLLLNILKDKDRIQKSKLTPISVYITLCNYMKNGKPLKHEKAKIAAEKEARRRSKQIYDPKTQTWHWNVTRRHPKEIKIWGIDQPTNTAVVESLEVLLNECWLLTPATGAKYMITMDMRHHMFKGRHFCKNYVVPKPKSRKLSLNGNPSSSGSVAGGSGGGTGGAGAGGVGDSAIVTEKRSKKHLEAQCFYNRHVIPGYAAIVVALQILKREKDVKIAVFSDEGVNIVSIDPKFLTIKEMEHTLRQNTSLGKVQLDAPILWASEQEQQVDMFVSMIDRPSRYMELAKKDRAGRGFGGRYGPPPPPESKLADRCPVRALLRYRQERNMPNSKMIVMSLASHRVGTANGTEGVLDIIGIDHHVPKVMDAFVLGQFN